MQKEKNKSPKQETRKFKAEVKQILDIVVNSLYTHREIFVRELISNSFDSLEKMRHKTLTNKKYTDKEAPLEITINTDKENHTITVTDTGVGMTHDELVDNLGTIARSGTLEYVKNIGNKVDMAKDMIGKFGVGFYSAFMVGTEVRVKTRSYDPTEKGYEWFSDGIGQYKITEVDNLPRGTSVTVKLKEDAYEYDNPENIKPIINKYSNFVSFPILIEGERVNTVQAIWLKSSSEVTDDEYKEFYKFLSNSEEDALLRLHLTSDAPIQLSSILYIPQTNFEKFGFMKLKPSVNLYCKKILLQQHTEKLIPEYMRFVTGVVDSADLTLNISRETIQDNLVFRKLGKFLTKRILRFLTDQAKNEKEKYATFWDSFNMFLKEGILSDFENRKELTGLLRFNSSKTGKDELVSLEDYIENSKDDSKTIYYLTGVSKEEIENGPYVETFKERNIEVLYLFDAIDDFIMTTLSKYEGHKLVSADSSDIALPETEDKKETETDEVATEVNKNFHSWVQEILGDKVSDVRESKRILNRPAIIVNPDAGITTSMRRVMKAAGKDMMGPGAQILEINHSHPLIKKIKELRAGKTDKGFLLSCVEQVYDNALTEAGLMENPRTMIERIYEIMDRALKEETPVSKKGKK
ncbi:molecular chaperone HtpG [Candidatus Latescibacterota bacterium]